MFISVTCPFSSSRTVKNRVLNRVSSVITSSYANQSDSGERPDGWKAGNTPLFEAIASVSVSRMRFICITPVTA